VVALEARERGIQPPKSYCLLVQPDVRTMPAVRSRLDDRLRNVIEIDDTNGFVSRSTATAISHGDGAIIERILRRMETVMRTI
jgi:hypothetical protein